MSWLVVLAVALVTYLSRLVGLVAPRGFSDRTEAVLERAPAPLFAALAATALVTADRATPLMWLAAVGAVAAILLQRSLVAALAGGLAGFGFALLAGG